MTTLRIQTNNTFDTIVTVRESDKYTKQIYFKFETSTEGTEARGCAEHFMTPVQLLELAKFLEEQARVHL